MECVRCGESYHVSIIRQFGFYKCRICGKDYCNNCVYVVSTYFGKLVRFRVCKTHIDALVNSVSVPLKAQELEKVGCEKSDEAKARGNDTTTLKGNVEEQVVVGSERTSQEPKEEKVAVLGEGEGK